MKKEAEFCGEAFGLKSPLGALRVRLRAEALLSIEGAAQKEGGRRRLDFPFQGAWESPFACFVREQLEAYFAGRLREFSLPLSSDQGTEFQKKAWRALQAIPFGETRSYGALAGQAGCPQGARAFGGACARNPFLIVVPCHRALAQGGLGGFALGLKAKKTLLRLEGAFPPPA